MNRQKDRTKPSEHQTNSRFDGVKDETARIAQLRTFDFQLFDLLSRNGPTMSFRISETVVPSGVQARVEATVSLALTATVDRLE